MPENAALTGEGALAITARAIEEIWQIRVLVSTVPLYFCAPKNPGSVRSYLWPREARLKLPMDKAFAGLWMLGANIADVGWPDCGEIDIMENIGREPATVYGTVHGPGYSGAGGISTAVNLEGGTALKDDFHVFALEWEPDKLQWYMDDQLYAIVHKSQFPTEKHWVFDHVSLLS